MSARKRKYSFNANSANAETTPLLPASVPRPTLYYSNKVWRQMWYLIDKCPQEVGWLGLVDECPGGYIVTHLLVPEQTVCATETDIGAETLAKVIFELMKKDLDPGKLLYWGHSHVNMGVTPSGQDETQVDEFLENAEIFFRGIYNKKGESRVDAFDTRNRVVHQRIHDGIFVPQLTKADTDILDKVIETNVKPRVYTTPVYQPGKVMHGYYTDNDVYSEYPHLASENSAKKTTTISDEDDAFCIINMCDGKTYDMFGNEVEQDECDIYTADPTLSDLVREEIDMMYKGKYEALDGSMHFTARLMFHRNRELLAQGLLPKYMNYLNKNTTVEETPTCHA